MSVLSVCSDAAKQMGKTAPSTVFGSSDTFARELSALINESALAVMKFHDWQKLKVLQTQTGTGSTTDFDLPDDYDRMPIKASVYRSSTIRPMRHVIDEDEWLRNRLQSFSDPVGEWILLGGKMSIYPAMSVSESAKWYYISNKCCADNSAVPKASFTADTDTYRLPERLLTLSLIWRWREMKGLDYAEEMQNFEIAQAQEVSRDKGSRIITVGRARMPDDVQLAYPGTINA